MTSAAALASRFVRRTSLGEDEYRVNFKQIDCDILDALASDEACAVTPSMSKIYIRLLRAPISCWESEGVLRFVGEEREGKALTAWEQLVELTGVANSTLSKALAWMHKTGLIGYHARKNGVGIRIFINRASSSIRKRGQKILRLVPTPPDRPPAPSDGAPFKEAFSGEDLDKGINPRAHSRAATAIASADLPSAGVSQQSRSKPHDAHTAAGPPAPLDLSQVVGAVKRELEPVITSTCGAAISSALRKDAALNRGWLEEAALPKAVRVAMREAFDLLRSYGVIAKKPPNGTNVGRNSTASSDEANATDSVRMSIVASLGEAGEAIRQVAASDQVSCNPVLLGACRAAVGELDCLRDRAAAGERRLPTDLDDLESRLKAAEDGIMEALWRSTGSEEIEAMFESARIELRRYEGTMRPEVYRDTLRRHVDNRLRERHGIPRLGLFYM